MGGSIGPKKLVNVVLSGLPGELQEIRNRCGLSLEVACDPLKWQQSKLSRMENGQQCISDVDLGSLFVLYKVASQERNHLLHLAQRQDDPGYWEVASPEAEESRTVKRLERSTTAIVDVAPTLIPELVQTADYARAVMESDGVPTEHIAARVDERLERQSILTKEKAPKLDLIVSEAALRRPMGGRDVTTKQLRVLQETAEQSDVRFRIVPFAVSGDAGLHTAFSMMEFKGARSVVYLQHPTTGLFLEQQDKIESYRRRVTRLATFTLEPAESLDLLASITREFEFVDDAAVIGLR